MATTASVSCVDEAERCFRRLSSHLERQVAFYGGEGAEHAPASVPAGDAEDDDHRQGHGHRRHDEEDEAEEEHQGARWLEREIAVARLHSYMHELWALAHMLARYAAEESQQQQRQLSAAEAQWYLRKAEALAASLPVRSLPPAAAASDAAAANDHDGNDDNEEEEEEERGVGAASIRRLWREYAGLASCDGRDELDEHSREVPAQAQQAPTRDAAAAAMDGVRAVLPDRRRQAEQQQRVALLGRGSSDAAADGLRHRRAPRIRLETAAAPTDASRAAAQLSASERHRLETHRTLQDDIAEELSDSVGHIKTHAQRMHDTVRDDNCVLDETQQRVELNVDRIRAQRKSLAEYVRSRTGATCAQWAMMAAAVAVWLLVLALIKAT